MPPSHLGLTETSSEPSADALWGLGTTVPGKIHLYGICLSLTYSFIKTDKEVAGQRSSTNCQRGHNELVGGHKEGTVVPFINIYLVLVCALTQSRCLINTCEQMIRYADDWLRPSPARHYLNSILFLW